MLTFNVYCCCSFLSYFTFILLCFNCDYIDCFGTKIFMSKIKSIKLLIVDYSSGQLQSTPSVFKKLAAQKILTMACVKSFRGPSSYLNQLPFYNTLKSKTQKHSQA